MIIGKTERIQRHTAEISMRILMIIDGLLGGGAEKMLLTLAQGLVSHGHRASIFSLQRVCDYALPDGIEYQIIADHASPLWRKLTELSRWALALDKAMLISQQRNGEFDLVVSYLHKTDHIVARSLILPRDRIWFCMHTMFSLGYLGHRKGFSHWLKCQKIHALYQNRNIIAVSRGVLDDRLPGLQCETAPGRGDLQSLRFQRDPPAGRGAL